LKEEQRENPNKRIDLKIGKSKERDPYSGVGNYSSGTVERK